MIELFSTALVRVLFDIVCDVVRSAVTAVSIDTVTVPDVPPPEIPVPAVTPVISPAASVTQTKSMSALLFFEST